MRQKQKHHKRGFSLIEILIAVIVLAIGIMGMLGALSYGLKAGENSSRMSKCTNFSRRLLERIIIDGAWTGNMVNGSEPKFDPTDQSTWTPVDASPYNTLFNDAGDRAMYYRQIQYILPGAPDPDGEPVTDKVVGTSTWENTRLARVKVTITFFDKSTGVAKSYSSWAYCARP